MTLGKIIALIPFLESSRGALGVVVSKIRLGVVSPWLFANHPMGNPPPPDGYTWSLPLLYLVWGVAIVILYLACRWYARDYELFSSTRRSSASRSTSC